MGPRPVLHLGLGREGLVFRKLWKLHAFRQLRRRLFGARGEGLADPRANGVRRRRAPVQHQQFPQQHDALEGHHPRRCEARRCVHVQRQRRRPHLHLRSRRSGRQGRCVRVHRVLVRVPTPHTFVQRQAVHRDPPRSHHRDGRSRSRPRHPACHADVGREVCGPRVVAGRSDQGDLRLRRVHEPELLVLVRSPEHERCGVDGHERHGVGLERAPGRDRRRGGAHHPWCHAPLGERDREPRRVAHRRRLQRRERVPARALRHRRQGPRDPWPVPQLVAPGRRGTRLVRPRHVPGFPGRCVRRHGSHAGRRHRRHWRQRLVRHRRHLLGHGRHRRHGRHLVGHRGHGRHDAHRADRSRLRSRRSRRRWRQRRDHPAHGRSRRGRLRHGPRRRRRQHPRSGRRWVERHLWKQQEAAFPGRRTVDRGRVCGGEPRAIRGTGEHGGPRRSRCGVPAGDAPKPNQATQSVRQLSVSVQPLLETGRRLRRLCPALQLVTCSAEPPHDSG